MIIRKTKKRLARFDEMTLPAMEKMLPSEALVKEDASIIRKRKVAPRIALASLAMVTLIVATALVIGSAANSANDTQSEELAVLDNELSVRESFFSSAVAEESEKQKANLPIVSCGKASMLFSSNELPAIEPGDVAVETMRNSRIPIEELQDDVVYAVWFSADYWESPQYKEGIKRLDDEERKNKYEQADKVIAYLKEHEKEEYEDCIEAYKECSLDDFRDFVLDYVSYSFPNGERTPQWLAPIVSELRQNYEEHEKKREEFRRQTRDTSNAKMHEYLESIGIEFYDKTVYLYTPKFDHDADEYNYDEKEIHGSRVYRMAFLTKEEIASLKGDEDYGIAVVIAFDEMAKRDTEPVYLMPWVVNA